MTEVERLGKVLAKARVREGQAMEELVAAVRFASELGAAEVDLARQAGVNRTTIRRMLGKQP